MPHITFDDQGFELQERESVLEGLLRHGVAVRSSCRSGICQSCMMQSMDSEPPPASQKGLKDSLKRSQHFLACQCHPESDMNIALPGATVIPWQETTVIAKEPLSGRVMRLTLHRPDNFIFEAGQFVNLLHGDLIRSYSISNVPDDRDAIELHVYRIDDGRMSNWLHDRLAIGDSIDIQGPFGDCIYPTGNPQQPLLLIGTGCGLAPLRGIIHAAIQQGHEAPIHLFHGSRSTDGVYLVEEMRALEERHPQFNYVPCLSDGNIPKGYMAGRAADIALARFPSLKNWRIFLCGNTAMVKAVKRRAYLAGAALNDIHADPFEFSHAANAAVCTA